MLGPQGRPFSGLRLSGRIGKRSGVKRELCESGASSSARRRNKAYKHDIDEFVE